MEFWRVRVGVKGAGERIGEIGRLERDWEPECWLGMAPAAQVRRPTLGHLVLGLVPPRKTSVPA